MSNKFEDTKDDKNAPSGIVPLSEQEFVNILKKIEPSKEWPTEIKEILKEHPEIKLRDIPGKSMRNQVICIFASNQGVGFNRGHLQRIGEKLGVTTGDAIQWANKINRVGINIHKAGTLRERFYGFERIEFIDKYLRSNEDLSTDLGRKKSEERIRKLFADYSSQSFERGHKDPRKPLEDNNLVMQPYEINRSYRDKYIFDDNGMPKVPNPEQLVRNPLIFYDREDLKYIYEGLGEFLGD